VSVRESPLGWQTGVETPREENGLAGLIDMRKSPPVEHHTGVVPRYPQIPAKDKPTGGRPQTKGSAPPVAGTLTRCAFGPARRLHGEFGSQKVAC
jgi:hypothetical protein